jgi:hypothetical protein
LNLAASRRHSAASASIRAAARSPKNTPVEIVDILNRQINADLADAKLKNQLAELGNVALALSPNGVGKLIADETENWAKVSNSPASSRNDQGNLSQMFRYFQYWNQRPMSELGHQRRFPRYLLYVR